MKYESNILKRLIDTYGVIGNPRYLSEIIKEFIVRGKELYPQLFTYQSDWLAHIDEFGLTPEYTVSYTGQSIYAPNTLERPVKSAILKGSTKYRDIDTGDILDTFDETKNLELVSVKVPVLTTTGKNLFDFKLEGGNHGGGFNNIRCKTVEVEELTTYTISNNMDYIINLYLNDKNNNEIGNATGTSNQPSLTFTTPQGTKYMWFRTWSNMNDINVKFQMEKGTQATSYEPFKSNILTVNEDVTLRGIGDVKDTLDLTTGELTQRIGEIVLDGSEEWGIASNGNGSFRFQCTITDLKNYGVNSNGKGILVNNLPITNFSNSNTYGITTWQNKVIIYDTHSSLSEFKEWLSQTSTTIQYVLETPIVKTVDLTILDQNGQSVYHLKSFNGGTHVYTSSLEGSLVPSVDISVVTNLEETLKICSLEGNTM